MLFIYENRNTGEIEVMEADALDIGRHDAKDWKLIASLDPKVYVRSLLREYPDLVRQLKGIECKRKRGCNYSEICLKQGACVRATGEKHHCKSTDECKHPGKCRNEGVCLAGVSR